MVYASDIYVTLSLDPTNFNAGVTSAAAGSKKLETEFNALDMANRKTATGIRNLGMTASLLANDIALVNPELSGMSSAVAALGGASLAVGPAIKSVGFINKELKDRITDATKAMTMQQVVLSGIGGGILLGGTLIAYEALTYTQKVNKEAAEALKEALKDQAQALKDLERDMDSYISKSKELQRMPTTKEGAQLNLESAALDVATNEAKYGYNSIQARQARNRFATAKYAYEDVIGKETVLTGTGPDSVSGAFKKTIEDSTKNIAATAQVDVRNRIAATYGPAQERSGALFKGMMSALIGPDAADLIDVNPFGILVARAQAKNLEAATKYNYTPGAGFVASQNAMRDAVTGSGPGTISINLNAGQTYTTPDGGLSIRYNGVQNGGLH